MSENTTNHTLAERFYLSEEELQERLDRLLPKETPTIPILRKFQEKSSTATAVLVVGMAGSGKTTLMGQLFHSLSQPFFPQEDTSGATTTQKNKGGYFMNLDPATLTLPFSPNIDIRDTVDYKVRTDVFVPKERTSSTPWGHHALICSCPFCSSYNTFPIFYNYHS